MSPAGPSLPPEPGIVPAAKLEGRVVAALSALGGGFVTAAAGALALDLEGVPGDRHRGWTRPADSRVPWHPRGEAIRNVRQISIVSVEELAAIAGAMSLPEIRAEWLGANLVLEGVPRLSFLPAGTRLFCASGAVLAVEGQNGPCRHPGRVIAAHYSGCEGLDLLFPKAARRLRGVVASVERAGVVARGDTVEIRLPEQWIYPV